MYELINGYHSEIDNVDEASWYNILRKFDDVSIYQTWAYETIRSDIKNLSHMVLKKNEEIVAAAQVKILRIPLLNVGIAYVRWGPFWRMHNTPISIEVLSQAVRALKNEYVHKRGLLLRIFPLFYNDEEGFILNVLNEEEFFRVDNSKPDRTLIMYLNNSLQDLRKGLKQKWRNQLNAAERNNLSILEGNDDELFSLFIGVYRQMENRKVLPRVASIDEFWRIQKNLPENFKLRVFVCMNNNTPCAGAVCSSIGDTGVYLFGATNEIAMKNKASYLVQWKVIEWLKNSGCTKYDLHGINPEKNPGNYVFKSGLCGNNGKDVYFLGVFEACHNDFNYYSIRFGDGLRSFYDRTTEFIRKYRTM